MKQFKLIILSLFLAGFSQAEVQTIDCYENDLQGCQGSSSIAITRDTATGETHLYEHSYSMQALWKPQAYKNIRVVTYGDNGDRGIKVSGTPTKELLDILELKSGERTLLKNSRVSLEILPTPDVNGKIQNIGTVRYKLAGVKYLSIKAQCGNWIKGTMENLP